MKKIFLYLVIIFFSLLSGCSSSVFRADIIRIKGSDTMLRLTELLAAEYMKLHPGVSVYVDGGGTATGINALANGDIDICTASRNLKGDEVKLLADKFGTIGISFLIAKDGLTIFVNPENPVRNFTMEELKNIFTCRISNWRELGGEDAPINAFTRHPNSGTYLYFKEHILEGEDYCESTIIGTSTEKLVEIVLEDPYAISYGGIGYTDERISASINGIKATNENVINDNYPISRYLHFYTLDTPEGAAKRFIDWVLSSEGQKIVRQARFIPLWDAEF